MTRRSGTVLLVDDEPVVLRMQAAGVRQFGFEALIAENVDEALSTLKSCEVDLIVSDVQMPGKGGFDLAHIVTDEGLKYMPFVFLTGYDDLEIVRNGLRYGGDDFIIKGKSIDHVRRRIAFWMASGFRELPPDLRRRALAAANALRGDTGTSVEHLIVTNDSIGVSVGALLKAEIKSLPPTYGKRMIERICILGRASKLVIEQCTEAGDFVRFPDYVYRSIVELGYPWSNDLAPLLRYFDALAADKRFLEAGVKQLSLCEEYEWFQGDEG
ncbi:hypothetical protein GCM10017044_19220 [Kordiimonas sediminis]|uniref:Response regulatory domain-containing protein n=1 Tax=Kordiimonas sediminis TaxID=1735581 RepID=A0A919E8A7_9PROT|nr:response regulator [Kordiimonas sediminis]GHF24692.1 hypothetical protein GCM10017044_19220 [Kordiimonas sediminis]